MDNNNGIPKEAEGLAAMLQKAMEFKGIVEKLQNGEGLGLNDEQKAEFVKQMQAEGPAQAVKEVTKQFENLQNAILNLNNQKKA